MTSPPGAMFIILNTPPRWPPPHPVTVQRTQVNGANLELIVDHLGRFGIHCLSDGTNRLHMFQRVLFSGPGSFVVYYAWPEDAPCVAINDENLLLDPTGDGPFAFITPKQDNRGQRTRLYPTLSSGRGADPAARIFLETILDVDNRVVSGTPYDLIRAGGLLRQLLLDGGDSLVELVNRSYREKLQFTIPESLLPQLQEIGLSLANFWRTLDPDSAPGAPTLTVSRDKLLATVMLQSPNATATVKDVIKACANSKGGIHLGLPPPGSEEFVICHDAENQLLDKEPSLYAVAEICRVVLKGLRPLVDKLLRAT